VPARIVRRTGGGHGKGGTALLRDVPEPPATVAAGLTGRPRVGLGERYLLQAIFTIFRRMNAICVASGRFFGHTSWQASSDMQPNTPSSSPITS